MSNPANWIRRIAEIPTVNDHMVSIGAQVHDGHRLLLIDDQAVDISQELALIDAIKAAAAALRAA